MNIDEATGCVGLLKLVAKLKIEDELSEDHVAFMLKSKKIKFLERPIKSRSRCKYVDDVSVYFLSFGPNHKEGKGFLSVAAKLGNYEENVGVSAEDIRLYDDTGHPLTPERLVFLMSKSGIDDLAVRLEALLFNKV